MNSRQRGRSSGSVLDQYQHEIGVIPNREIAQKAGCSVSYVYSYGVKHGLLSAQPSRSLMRMSNCEQHDWLIGRFPDAIVAGIIGCSSTNVFTYRKRRGIPAVTKTMMDRVRAAVEAIPRCGDMDSVDAQDKQ